MNRFSSVVLAAFLVAATLLNLAPRAVLAASVEGVLQKARAEGRLSGEESAAIEDALENAKRQELPMSPFAAKIEEGLAKRMPGTAILQAVGAMQKDYAFAREALARSGEAPTPEGIVMTGDSLRLGLSRQELSILADLKPSAAMLAAASRTWACLNAIDFSPRLSEGIMRSGIAAGSLSPDWIQLYRVAQRARKAGLSDIAVAEAASRILTEGEGIPALLQELGFTTRDTRQAPGGENK
jgi:hypothetical protein